MRADKFLAERFGSRTKAAEEIEKGRVLIGGKPVRPKDEVLETDEIEILEAEEYFVSNGGYKLSKALKDFSFDCSDLICADIGASTGGFCDCLLQNGAKKVYAVDVGESLLHEKLQKDKRVISLENINARYLKNGDLPEEVDLVTADVSFISLKLVLPALYELSKPDGEAIVLLKPQFECQNKNIGKSGIVHTSAHQKILEKALGYCDEAGWKYCDITNAPIRKGKNVEYVLSLKKSGVGQNKKEMIKKLEQILFTIKKAEK